MNLGLALPEETSEEEVEVIRSVEAVGGMGNANNTVCVQS